MKSARPEKKITSLLLSFVGHNFDLAVPHFSKLAHPIYFYSDSSPSQDMFSGSKKFKEVWVDEDDDDTREIFVNDEEASRDPDYLEVERGGTNATSSSSSSAAAAAATNGGYDATRATLVVTPVSPITPVSPEPLSSSARTLLLVRAPSESDVDGDKHSVHSHQSSNAASTTGIVRSSSHRMTRDHCRHCAARRMQRQVSEASSYHTATRELR